MDEAPLVLLGAVLLEASAGVVLLGVVDPLPLGAG